MTATQAVDAGAPVAAPPPPAPVESAPPKPPDGRPSVGSYLPVLGSLWMLGMFALGSISNEHLDRLWDPLAYLIGTRFIPCILGILGLFVALGLAKVGRAAGVLITAQNVMSLSRFQMVLWTTLVLGFFAAVVLARLAGGATDPLNVGISGEVWGLLGITTGSLVGTPFLLSARREKDPVDMAQEASVAAAKFGEKPDDVAERAQGPLYVNPSSADAEFSDIFEGDELSNTYRVDVAKVQMFLFTAVSAIVWTVCAARLIVGSEVLNATVALPGLPSGMVTLLGVSNVGYLANKMVDHTPTK